MKLNFEKNKKELSLLERIIYYRGQITIYTISFIYLINEFLNKKFESELQPSHKITFIIIFISLIVVWKKNKALKLKTFKTCFNKDEVVKEIEKMASEFSWQIISSTENQFNFKINTTTFYHSEIDLSNKSKRFLNLIIVVHTGLFKINIMPAIENFELIDVLGEKTQLENLIINRLKSTNK
jgi:hypothetical protein